MGPTNTDFPFWELFFLVRENHVKSDVFCQNQRKFGWIFFENNWKYFSTIFLQKRQILGDFSIFLGVVILAIRKKKKY